MKFIYLCAAIIVLSFTAAPAFYGVSEERNAILASNEQPTIQEDVIEVAVEDAFDPASLNEIAPAAGIQEDTGFSSGFSGVSDAALTDFEPVEEAETSEDVSNN